MKSKIRTRIKSRIKIKIRTGKRRDAPGCTFHCLRTYPSAHILLFGWGGSMEGSALCAALAVFGVAV